MYQSWVELPGTRQVTIAGRHDDRLGAGGARHLAVSVRIVPDVDVVLGRHAVALVQRLVDRSEAFRRALVDGADHRHPVGVDAVVAEQSAQTVGADVEVGQHHHGGAVVAVGETVDELECLGDRRGALDLVVQLGVGQLAGQGHRIVDLDLRLAEGAQEHLLDRVFLVGDLGSHHRLEVDAALVEQPRPATVLARRWPSVVPSPPWRHPPGGRA